MYVHSLALTHSHEKGVDAITQLRQTIYKYLSDCSNPPLHLSRQQSKEVNTDIPSLCMLLFRNLPQQLVHFIYDVIYYVSDTIHVGRGYK